VFTTTLYCSVKLLAFLNSPFVKCNVFYVEHAVFRVNGTDARRSGTTQFGRALRDLSIELICANSSQAKGRVERANQTLQDRLVKEMRLHNISSISEANRWVVVPMVTARGRASGDAFYAVTAIELARQLPCPCV
jgi:hypothetical protein